MTRVTFCFVLGNGVLQTLRKSLQQLKIFLREKREAKAIASKLKEWKEDPLEQCEKELMKRINRRQIPVDLPMEVNRVR